MQKVLTAAEMREVDRLTTERYGIPSILLMENAAHAVARVITEKLGGSVKGKSILILCGKGNNGGDGAALGRILWTQGATVDLFLLGVVEETKGDAHANFEIAKQISDRDFQATPLLSLHECPDLDWRKIPDVCHYNVFVDALFGTGLTRPLDEETKQFVMKLRGQKNRELSVSIDIPSGLGSDSGEIIGPVFPTDFTVTFTSPKHGNVLPPACAFNGSLVVASIGSPTENFELDGYLDDFKVELLVTQKYDVQDWLTSSQFENDSYKNKRGHILLIAGSDAYSGAAVLAGNAAMRSGVGLVTVVTPGSSKESVAARVLPEVMVRGVAETETGAVAEEAFDELTELLAKANAVAVGSGLSQSESTRKFVEKLIENRRQPVVVDADALNLLSPFEGRRFSTTPSAEAAATPPYQGGEFAVILTPHEGEFLRLLGKTDSHPDAEASPLFDKEESFKKDRVAAVREFSQKHKVILVLKGERVLIGEPGGKVVVNPTGNSGLGKAGNGDTLTGIIAGFVAQAAAMDIDIFETVVAAVYIAGMAGDIAESKYGKRVMTASDVRECLADAFKELNFSNI